MGYDLQSVLGVIAGCERALFATEKNPGSHDYHRSTETVRLASVSDIAVCPHETHALEPGTCAVLRVQPPAFLADKITVRISGTLGEREAGWVRFFPEKVELLDTQTNQPFQTFKLF